MIVMSFGFDEPIPLIREAIDRASKAEKAPLFFAATRNNGAHRRMAWPAKDRLVIGVSSTDGNGHVSRFNPLAKYSDPILHALGEGVPVSVANPRNPDKWDTQHVSGTSYAPAVAAALAANLLGCVRMVMEMSSREEQAIYSHVPGQLQRMDGMLAVLRRHMQKEHGCGVKSLLPWDFLNDGLLDGNTFFEDIDEAMRKE